MTKITQSDIAKAWCVSRAYVSKLVGRGMPLDSLEGAAAWREAHSKKPPRGQQPPEPVSPKTVSTPRVPIHLDEDFLSDTGLEAEVERFRKATRQAAADYKEAMVQNLSPAEIRGRLNLWTTLTEHLRKLEKDLPRVLKEAGNIVSVPEAEMVMGQMLNLFRQSLLNGVPSRLTSKLRGLSDEEAFWAIQEEMERALGILNNEVQAWVKEVEGRKGAEPTPDREPPTNEE